MNFLLLRTQWLLCRGWLSYLELVCHFFISIEEKFTGSLVRVAKNRSSFNKQPERMKDLLIMYYCELFKARFLMTHSSYLQAANVLAYSKVLYA